MQHYVQLECQKHTASHMTMWKSSMATRVALSLSTVAYCGEELTKRVLAKLMVAIEAPALDLMQLN